MAGHSHAANIMHRKGAVDAKRGKLFSKLCRAIYVAAKNGGADPAANIRLRYANFKLAVVSEGIHNRYLAGKTVGAGFDHFGNSVPLLLHAALGLLEKR